VIWVEPFYFNEIEGNGRMNVVIGEEDRRKGGGR
jgi:hypothetical protein